MGLGMIASRWGRGICQALVPVVVFGITICALDVEYIGSIQESLYAPTSLEVFDDGLAVLEPFSNEIKVFSPSGILTQRLHLTGEARGLVRIADGRFLFCDRERRAVMVVNLEAGTEEVHLGETGGLIDPVDLVLDGEQLYILDAGRAEILEINSGGTINHRIPLLDDEGEPLEYASSFCYNPVNQQFYVLDQLNSRICVVAQDGTPGPSFGSFGRGVGQLTRGGEIAATPGGRICVTDRFQGQVLIFEANGEYLGQLDDPLQNEPTMAIPTGIDVDESGLVYVASTMSPAIGIYRVALAQQSSKLAAALPELPPDGAELKANEVRLVAYAEPQAEAFEVTGFEFQIFVESDLEKPEIEAQGVIAEAQTIGQPGTLRLTAQWSPEAEFDDELEYFWRTRTQFADTAGEWSSMRSFRVTALPTTFRLDQNFPNPFNPETKIGFSLPRASDVTLEVFSLLGRRVMVIHEGELPAGHHLVEWDGTNERGSLVASGVYFYRLSADGYVQTKKMVLLK